MCDSRAPPRSHLSAHHLLQAVRSQVAVTNAMQQPPQTPKSAACWSRGQVRGKDFLSKCVDLKYHYHQALYLSSFLTRHSMKRIVEKTSRATMMFVDTSNQYPGNRLLVTLLRYAKCSPKSQLILQGHPCCLALFISSARPHVPTVHIHHGSCRDLRPLSSRICLDSSTTQAITVLREWAQQ